MAAFRVPRLPLSFSFSIFKFSLSVPAFNKINILLIVLQHSYCIVGDVPTVLWEVFPLCCRSHSHCVAGVIPTVLWELFPFLNGIHSHPWIGGIPTRGCALFPSLDGRYSHSWIGYIPILGWESFTPAITGNA